MSNRPARPSPLIRHLAPKSRMDASSIIQSLGVPHEAISQSRQSDPSQSRQSDPSQSRQSDPSQEELVSVFAQEADAQPIAWSTHFFGHLKRSSSCKQTPLRQLVKWRVEDPLVHAFCNVIPTVADPSALIRTRSMLWMPADFLFHPEIMRGLSHLVYVQRRPVGQMVKGPPPTNYLMTLASERPAKPFYWIPTRRDLDSWAVTVRDQCVAKVGVPYVLIDVLTAMYPAYGEIFCAKFVRCESDPYALEDWRRRTTIKLESLEEDRYAIPQKEAVEATVRSLGAFSTVLLNGYCGSGKTVMMIEIVSRVGLKAAILVNKHDLAIQWEQRFRSFAPDMRVKQIVGNTGDMTDCDVAICQIKSLYSRQQLAPWDHGDVDTARREADEMFSYKGRIKKLTSRDAYPWPWLASFGLVCVDEAHRIVPATALPCLALFPNAKILCATATPDRQDATHDSLGPVFGVASAVLQQPHVAMGVQVFGANETECLVPVWRWKRKKYEGKEFVNPASDKVDFEDVNYSRMVRNLELDASRNVLLLGAIWDAAIVKGRQTLVLGLIKSHLVALAAVLHQRIVESKTLVSDRLPCGLLFPETKAEHVEAVKCAHVIFATFQYASEAFDVGTLSALVLVSPYKSRLVQVLGRILRRKRGGAVATKESRECSADAHGWMQHGAWSQLPLVYLCDDELNPWFHNTCVKQLAIIKRTYQATVERVEPTGARFSWPDDVEAIKQTFALMGQTNQMDVLFRDDEEDLFGDRGDPGDPGDPGDRGDYDEDEDEDGWFE